MKKILKSLFGKKIKLDRGVVKTRSYLLSNVCGFGNYSVLAEQDEQTFDSLRQQVSMTAAASKQIDNSRSDRQA